ncbi:MAG: hypothetical protein NT067_04960 [Candidatus Diapherotrites archaeon]|nr:hypothetical protein [Candidatus Diapherotrites archaeon]
MPVPKNRFGQIRKAVKMRKKKEPHSPEEIQRIAQETGLSVAEAEEIVRRRDTAFLIHGTSDPKPESGIAIARNGFSAAEMRRKQYQEHPHAEAIDIAFDNNRPEHILATGISRQASPYFHPDWASFRLEKSLVLPKSPHQLGLTVRARADATKTYVFDHIHVGSLYRFPPSESPEKIKASGHVAEKARKYWRSGIPINIFRERYRFDKAEHCWIRTEGPKSARFMPDGPKMALPEKFYSPEALAGGEIQPKDIRAGRAKQRKENH